MKSVWLVMIDDNGEGGSVDSCWSTEELAKNRANRVDTSFDVSVEEWVLDAPDRE